MIADDDLSLDALTVGVEVFQRKTGHRFSSDDVTTAWVGVEVCPRPARVLDLGCGLGSVLLHLAWSIPEAVLVGIEAQAISFALASRNVSHNRLADRVTVHHGDLRDAALLASVGAPFDLVTGTPPYFPPSNATVAIDEQRAYARIEYRGGIEAYIEAASKVLAPDGWFVVCGDSDASERIEVAAAMFGLTLRRSYIVIPRAGRPPLFSVWALQHGDTASVVEATLTLRDHLGERTADAKRLRAFSGFPEKAPHSRS